MLPTFLLALAAAPALAKQSFPVTGFEGSYDTWCTDADVNFHIGIALSVGGKAGSWSGGVTVPLPCDEVIVGDEEWTAVYDDLYDDCPAALLGATACDDAATAVADAFADLANGFLGLIPYQVDVDVNDKGWLSKVLGIYPATFTHHAPDLEWDGGYLVDNRDGTDGNFLSVALAMGIPSPELACVALALGVAEGNIDRDADYDLWADFALDEELVCVAADETAALVVSVGFAFTGSIDGEKQVEAP